MKIDLEEVKRHLEILGYSHIDPTLLNEFVEDLKKLIEYDQRHGDVNELSASLNKDWDDSYSERMKTSAANENSVDPSLITSSGANRRRKSSHVEEKQKNQDNSLRTSSKIINHHNTHNQNNFKCESEFMQQGCYFCAYIPMENQPKMKLKHISNPLATIHIGATFNIQL